MTKDKLLELMEQHTYYALPNCQVVRERDRKSSEMVWRVHVKSQATSFETLASALEYGFNIPSQ